jgi:zinc transporter
MTEETTGLLSSYEIVGREAHFEWHHLQSDQPETLRWLESRDVHPSVIEALTVLTTRPRAASLAGGTLLVVRGVNHNAGADPEDMISLRIWFTQGTVISTRRHGRPLSSVVEVQREIESGEMPDSVGDLLVRLLDHLAGRISDLIDDIDTHVDELENADDMRIAERRSAVIDWRRQTVAVRRFIAPQRDALAAFAMLPNGLGQEQVYSIQQIGERMFRFVEELDYARERALVLQEQLINELAEEQNKRIYVLSLVAAIFLPLSFLTGVFGMNVAGLPGTENGSAFLWVCLGMAATAALSTLFFWWRRWL